MADALEPGTVRWVGDGRWKGHVVTVVEDRGELVACAVVMYGDTMTVDIERAVLRAPTMTAADVAEIEAEVARGARARAPHRYRLQQWLATHVKAAPSPELDAERMQLLDELLALDRQVEDDALAEFRAAFASVPDADRVTWWAAQRATWTERPSGREMAHAILGRDPGDGKAWRAELNALLDMIADFNRRLDEVKHTAYSDDLGGTAPRANHPGLEAALDADPTDAGAWLAYGDWLLQHGDPRGELVIAQDGSPRGTELGARLLDRHERYFLGGLGRYGDAVTFTWRRGFIRTAKVVMPPRAHEEDGVSPAALVRTLLALPSARYLEELTIGCASAHETGLAAATIDALVTAERRPPLRRLAYALDVEAQMLSWTETGPLGAVWPRYPGLTEVDLVAGDLDLGELVLPALAALRIETCGLSSENLHALAHARVPALRRLELWFGPTEEPVERARDVAALLAAPALAGVTELGLVNASTTDELCAQLAAAPLLARLAHLDLSRGTLTDAGVEVLCGAHAAGRAPQLRGVDVRECYVSERGLAALAACGWTVRSDGQRTPDRYEGADYRYCAVGE